jgi:hypothetical protein
MKKKIVGLLALGSFLFISCTQQEEKGVQTENDWITLFDGTSLEGWKGYNGEGLPPGWTIQDSTMTFSTEVVLEQNYDYKGSKDIIYAAEEFDNFELYVEWKIPEGGNSGIFYHVKEGFDGIPEIAPEYQLIDDEGYTKMHDISDYNKSLGYTENLNELRDWQKTGSDYAMYPAKAEKKLNPAGEWNSSRIIFTPEKAEYYLNGDLVVSFIPWSDDWNNKKNNGKWKIANDYGKFKTGYIGFQDHGSGLAFRNVKIRKL